MTPKGKYNNVTHFQLSISISKTLTGSPPSIKLQKT